MSSSVFLFLLLLLFLLRTSTSSLPPPRTSFLLNSPNRALLHFPDIVNTTTLLLSEDASTLYVGGRDAVLSLDVSQSDVIRLKGKVDWSPSAEEVSSCLSKGRSSTFDCLNFVHVLQPINSTHLYACGSFAYSPRHAFIDSESFSVVHQEAAKGRCPFSPLERSSAVTIDGELFTATTTDFRGVKPQISRYFSRDGRPDVSLDTSISLLEEPTFVGSSLDASERKLYFFFTEVGKEFSFVNQLRIARVAQVCKDDVGGQRTLQKKWTSFAKAPLLCQSPKQRLFDVLQDVFTLQPPAGSNASETLFYGVFTSQWSSGSESAVCVFKLQDIRAEFARSYRTFNMQSHQWSPLLEKHSYLGKCGLATSSDSELEEVKKSFLTSGSVQPLGGGPIVVSSQQQYSRLTVTRAQAADGKLYTVLFLLTESGFLHKVVLTDKGPRVIEEIQVFTEPQRVKSLVLSPKGVLYVGTSAGVTAVPVANCSVHSSCSGCVLARDPLCGWSPARRVCSVLKDHQENMIQNLEGGDVEEECRGQTEVTKVTEVVVLPGEAVRLVCLRPSALASLTWTSSRFSTQTESLFIRSADSVLSFLATADTVGTYHCESEEAGHRERVASYDVQLTATPRSLRPLPQEPVSHDEPYEDVGTQKPETVGNPAADDDLMTEEATALPAAASERTISEESSPTGTVRKDTQSVPETRVEKSYHTELVVVSLLLVTCGALLVLGALYTWRQRKTNLKPHLLVSPEDGGRTNASLEICSLSSPKGAEPELRGEE